MILIKNMKMPETCWECKFADTFCLITRMSWQKNPNKCRQPDCPLVEAEPYGPEGILYKEK